MVKKKCGNRRAAAPPRKLDPGPLEGMTAERNWTDD